MAGSSRMVAGVPSRLLPPWLDTEMAVSPASTARRASSTRLTPLSMTGPPHCAASQAMSSQPGSGDCIHSAYAPKNVGAACPGRAMLGTVSAGSRPVRA